MAALLYASRAEDCPYEIVLVASNDPQAPGLALARAEGVETWAESHQGQKRAEFDAKIDAALTRAGVETVALAGYMRLLSPEFVTRRASGIVNIHPSLLPLYKGLDSHARTLAAGDSHGGCSVHVVTAEVDDGPVLGQTRVAILPGDTPETLAARVLIAEHQLYPRALADFVVRDTAPDALLARVRELAMGLPEAEETLSHGMACFGVIKAKKFAWVSVNHHGDGRTAVLVKISGIDEQADLIERDEERYYRPAYFGDGWIGIRLDRPPTDWAEIAERLETSWRMSAPKRLAMLPF